jgi:hypothetical protein
MKPTQNLIFLGAVVLALLVGTAVSLPAEASPASMAHVDPALVLTASSQLLSPFEVLASVNAGALGVAAVREADALIAANSRYGSSLGLSAVRATDASAPLYNSLLGVAAVRAFDGGAGA